MGQSTSEYLKASLLGVTLALTSSIATAGFVDEVGGSERINFAGKLRMLSQRIPAAACYRHADIEKSKTSEMLEAATAEFDTIIHGLEHGDTDLGMIGAEKDRRVLQDLKVMHEHWDYLHPEIEHIVDNGGSDAEVLDLAHASGPLLEDAKLLVSELVAEYSDPADLLQADAITIDIAGRQRMLAQRVSKNFCLLATGLGEDTAKGELAGTREMYSVSANALRFGLPAAGINATENQVILDGLDKVLADWATAQAILDQADAGTAISTEDQAFIFNTMNSLTGQMNKLVSIYVGDSKLGL